MALEMQQTYLETIAQILEAAGVLAILAGAAFALWEALGNIIRQKDGQKVLDLFRIRFAKSLLIGVEFLIAADIVGTVTIDPTMNSLAKLAIIVLIRTFLSFTLAIEIEGRWPWHRDLNRPQDD